MYLAEGVTREYLLHHAICPKRFDDGGALVVLAAPDALLDDALGDLTFAYRCRVKAEEGSREEVERMIERLTTQSDRILELSRSSDDEDVFATDVRVLADQPPVIRYVNLVVQDAFDSGASDVHLEASRQGLRARYRLDGILVPAPEPPAGLHQAVISRIKLLADLDIAERRRPQDGRIRVRLESRQLDLRVSTVPTMFGESVVLRLLDRGGRPVELEELGMSQDLLDAVVRLTRRPHGMILVTGPTGSGKTTTLYAALMRRQATAEKIITVEDPVEYELPAITQVPVHRHAGVTFGAALRSILRQDPDVIMVGEMRDRETAEVAVQAAMTGHLVFSTLHTNEAVAVVPRLQDLDVPGYLVAATLEGVVAQRLVRRTCDACRETYRPGPDVVAMLDGGSGGTQDLQRGAGCGVCRGTGYRGRMGLFELFRVNDEARDAIAGGATRADLRAMATASGMTPLRADGWAKVQAGITTVEEVLRVVQD